MKIIQTLAIAAFSLVTFFAHALPDDETAFKPDAVPEGKAMIYLFSTGYHSNELIRPVVYFDGKDIGTLHLSVYMQIITEPGKHNLKLHDRSLLLDDKTYEMSFDVEPGKHYYISYHGTKGKTVKTRNSKVQFYKMEIIPVEEKTAIQRLDDLRTKKQLKEMMKEE
jgi:hypothetical protein